MPWNLRGAVTSSTQFARTIGGAVGVALLGALLNTRVAGTADALVEAGAGGAGGAAGAAGVQSLVSALLTPAARAELPPATVEILSRAMADGLHRIYLALCVAGALGFLQVALFARRGVRDVRAAPAAASAAGTNAEVSTPAAALPFRR